MPAVQPHAEVVPLRPEAESGQDSQVTPLPTSPLALEADSAPVLRADATGSRPRPPKAPSHARVVPIRPALASSMHDTGDQAAEATTSTTGDQAAATPAGPDTSEPVEVKQPPFLASRSLAEDLTPKEPGKRTLRWLGVGLGAAGGCASLLVGGTDAPALAAAGGLFILAIIAALPLSYYARALAVSGLGATGLGFFSAGSRLRGERLDESLLAGAVFVLGAGLLFRAYHRGSRVARLVVVVGIAALAAWLVLSGGLGTLTHMDAAWQSWAPALPRVALALLGLISLLVFMDASTTAGGRIWASVLFVVHAAHVFLRQAVALDPPTHLGHAVSLPHPELAPALAIVVVVISGSVALAQLLAASATRRR
jgi:hypothetical protein